MKSESSPSSTQSKSIIQTQLHIYQQLPSTTQNSICSPFNPQSPKLKQHLSYHHLYPSLSILIHYFPPIPTTRPNHIPFHQSSPSSPHSHQQANTNHISPPLNPFRESTLHTHNPTNTTQPHKIQHYEWWIDMPNLTNVDLPYAFRYFWDIQYSRRG